MTHGITTVAVVGLGTMGSGVAEVLASAGLDVVAVEADRASLARGRARVEASTQRAATRGKLAAEHAEQLLRRIRYTDTLEDAGPAHLVIEAVPERLDLKQEIFGRLDRCCAPETIFATNTSSLSLTEISVATAHPARVVGMHFFNPAPVRGLVEVIRTVVTEQRVVDDVVALSRRLGKTPVVVGDRAGFIANALLFGYLNHAVTMFEQRYASREELDAAMTFGCGLPMGPLALMDLIGLDTAYEILDTMYRQGGDRLHAPAPVIKQLLTAGLTGRKTGRGFYTYDGPGSSTVVPDALTPSGAAAPLPSRPVERVAVVGSGTMATGIVEVFARAGLEVLFVARSKDRVDAAAARLAASLEKAVRRGTLDDAGRGAVLHRVQAGTTLADVANADLVVEAVVEDLGVKTALFERLDQVCAPGTVLATTTSSLPVIDCAARTRRPQDVVGMHFFNPAPVMRLVEVVHTVATAPDVVATVVDLCRRLGKRPVTCADRAGFIVNALLFPYLNDAVRMLGQHYADADDIDLAMRRGCGYPMGPFELLDVVGLDVALAIQQALHAQFREPGYAPAPLLEQLVTAGYLGRKTGRGFRAYA